MKKLGSLLKGVVLLGNILFLAALSLQVIRAPGKFALIAKEHLTLVDTYRDVQNWTPTDLQAHPALLNRLTEAGRLDLVAHIPNVTLPPQAAATPPGYQAPNPPIAPALDVPAGLVSSVQTVVQPPAPVNPLAKPAGAQKSPAMPKAAPSTDTHAKSIFNDD